MPKHYGFLLFEVLVAILVTSISLVVIMQGIGIAFRASKYGEDYFKACTLAEEMLAFSEKEQGVKAGSESGNFSSEQDPEGKFRWEQKNTAITRTSIFGATEIPICNAELTVKWKEKAGEKEVMLVTYLPKYEETPAER